MASESGESDAESSDKSEDKSENKPSKIGENPEDEGEDQEGSI
jgi:hypothetical protein